MANHYVSSVDYAAVTQWAAGQTVSTGAIRRQLATPSVGNERCFRCTTGGTTGGSEPSWNLGANATTNDNGVVWTECTGQEAYQGYLGFWAAPWPRLNEILKFGGRGSASGADTIFVADDHYETTAGALTWYAGGQVVVISVGGASMPPTKEDESYGAIVETTGASAISLGNVPNFKGIWFKVGTGASAASFSTYGQSTNGVHTLVDCKVSLLAAHSNSRIYLNGSNNGISGFQFINTPIEFSHVGQGIYFNVVGAHFYWGATPNAVQGTIPTNLFQSNWAASFNVLLEGVDLSAVNTTINGAGGGTTMQGSRFSAYGCKLHSSVTLVSQGRNYTRNSVVEFIGCTAASGFNGQFFSASMAGNTQTSTRIVRASGGATIDGTAYAHRLTANNGSSAAPTPAFHPTTPWITINNTVVGSPVTIELECITSKSGTITDDLVWMEVAYLGDSGGSTLWTMDNPGPSALMSGTPSTVTPSTEAWTSNVARANNIPYPVRTGFTAGGNTGRVFFNTSGSTQTTAASLPAGYASAVDGGTVTDNAATWRAGQRFKLSRTVTPLKAGPIMFRVHWLDTAANSTNAFDLYVDPKPRIS